jgi:hypothetical protein
VTIIDIEGRDENEASLVSLKLLRSSQNSWPTATISESIKRSTEISKNNA